MFNLKNKKIFKEEVKERMKKIMICLIAFMFMGANITATSFAAAAPSKALNVTASINSSAPEIDIVILKITDGNPDNNPWTNSTDVTSTMKLDFGSLGHTFVDSTGAVREAGVWYSPILYCVAVFTQGFGAKYEVRSSCTGIGTISNSNNYFGLSPVYSALDEFILPDGTRVVQGTKPPAAVLGTAGSAIGAAFKSIYISEPAPSTGRILQAYYSIPTRTSAGAVPYPGWTGIPLTQPGGTYSGTVTVSIAAI